MTLPGGLRGQVVQVGVALAFSLNQVGSSLRVTAQTESPQEAQGRAPPPGKNHGCKFRRGLGVAEAPSPPPEGEPRPRASPAECLAPGGAPGWVALPSLLLGGTDPRPPWLVEP